MLSIRLSKVGTKNKKMFRLTIAESARDPYGRSLEILGSYNPHTKELQAKNERITYWLSQGAQATKTVHNLLIEKGIVKGEKIKNVKISKKRQEKIKSKEAKPEVVESPAPEEKVEEVVPAEEAPTT